MKRTLGTIQVYTGNGKGKTTASLGLALRALGHGQKVFMIQFMKGSKLYGEVKMAKKLKGLTFVQSGRHCFVDRKNPDPKDLRLARTGLEKARAAVESEKYDLVILDEANTAMDFKLISVEDVMAMLDNKPRNVEVVLTGRGAPKRICDKADLVSEIKEVKHHYQRGIQARAGVER